MMVSHFQGISGIKIILAPVSCFVFSKNKQLKGKTKGEEGSCYLQLGRKPGLSIPNFCPSPPPPWLCDGCTQ